MGIFKGLAQEKKKKAPPPAAGAKDEDARAKGEDPQEKEMRGAKEKKMHEEEDAHARAIACMQSCPAYGHTRAIVLFKLHSQHKFQADSTVKLQRNPLNAMKSNACATKKKTSRRDNA